MVCNSKRHTGTHQYLSYDVVSPNQNNIRYEIDSLDNSTSLTLWSIPLFLKSGPYIIYKLIFYALF